MSIQTSFKYFFYLVFVVSTFSLSANTVVVPNSLVDDAGVPRGTLTSQLDENGKLHILWVEEHVSSGDTLRYASISETGDVNVVDIADSNFYAINYLSMTILDNTVYATFFARVSENYGLRTSNNRIYMLSGNEANGFTLSQVSENSADESNDDDYRYAANAWGRPEIFVENDQIKIIYLGDASSTTGWDNFGILASFENGTWQREEFVNTDEDLTGTFPSGSFQFRTSDSSTSDGPFLWFDISDYNVHVLVNGQEHIITDRGGYLDLKDPQMVESANAQRYAVWLRNQGNEGDNAVYVTEITNSGFGNINRLPISETNLTGNFAPAAIDKVNNVLYLVYFSGVFGSVDNTYLIKYELDTGSFSETLVNSQNVVVHGYNSLQAHNGVVTLVGAVGGTVTAAVIYENGASTIPEEPVDTDNDGIPDTQDEDDDNDGMPDTWEREYNLDPLDPADALTDSDNDGFTNLQEYLAGTDPTSASSFPNEAEEISFQSSQVTISASSVDNAGVPKGTLTSSFDSEGYLHLLWVEENDIGDTLHYGILSPDGNFTTSTVSGASFSAINYISMLTVETEVHAVFFARVSDDYGLRPSNNRVFYVSGNRDTGLTLGQVSEGSSDASDRTEYEFAADAWGRPEIFVESNSVKVLYLSDGSSLNNYDNYAIVATQSAGSWVWEAVANVDEDFTGTFDNGPNFRTSKNTSSYGPFVWKDISDYDVHTYVNGNEHIIRNLGGYTEIKDVQMLENSDGQHFAAWLRSQGENEDNAVYFAPITNTGFGDVVRVPIEEHSITGNYAPATIDPVTGNFYWLYYVGAFGSVSSVKVVVYHVADGSYSESEVEVHGTVPYGFDALTANNGVLTYVGADGAAVSIITLTPDGSPDTPTDTDEDGIPDSQDTDDDNDGLPDSYEIEHGLDPLNPSDANLDNDNDGYTNLQEYTEGTDPNDNGSYPGSVVPSTLTFSFESEDEISEWVLDSADGPWQRTTDQAYEQAYSLASSHIGDYQSSTASYSGVFIAGTLSFYVRVSSEYSYDYLRFYIDGQLIEQWSGEVEWTPVSYDISAGEHLLTWSYEKDSSLSSGDDKAWIDILTLPVGGTSNDTFIPFDFDGDKKADIAVRRPNTYLQYIRNSEDESVQRVSFGKNAADIPVSGDFDGDKIADVAVFRPKNRIWYIKNSSDGVIQRITLGREGDIPVPADYDGDGITDIAVWRPSTGYWYVKNSSGSNYNSEREDGIQRVRFGTQASDIPVPADYDGDQIADFAFRRPGTQVWYIKNSDGSNYNSEQMDGIQRIRFGGREEDIAVPADYDGDGKADLAVRRPSTKYWYIKNSSGTSFNSDKGDGIQRVQFGLDSEDIPIPADYDGDGYADIAVRRASNYMQYIRYTQSGTIGRINFGKNSADIPLAAPVVTRMSMLKN